jgi:hypothetical protein
MKKNYGFIMISTLPSNIRLGRKKMPTTNTLAYCLPIVDKKTFLDVAEILKLFRQKIEKNLEETAHEFSHKRMTLLGWVLL